MSRIECSSTIKNFNSKWTIKETLDYFGYRDFLEKIIVDLFLVDVVKNQIYFLSHMFSVWMKNGAQCDWLPILKVNWRLELRNCITVLKFWSFHCGLFFLLFTNFNWWGDEFQLKMKSNKNAQRKKFVNRSKMIRKKTTKIQFTMTKWTDN